MKKIYLFLFVQIFVISLTAQVSTSPSIPSTDDNITVIFDASQGNAALKNFTGNVYMHTGVLTSESTSDSDWKYTIGIWGTADTNVKMTSLGNNLYSKSYNIRTFHAIPAGIDVKKLAFVFRNSDGSIVAKTSNNTDIFVEANAFSLKNYVSHTVNNNMLTIVAENGKMTLEPYSTNMVKVAIYPDGIINEDTTYSVVISPSSTLANISITTDYLNFDCGELNVKIKKNPIRLSYEYGSNTVLSEDMGYFSTSSTKGLTFNISSDESIYGTGSRATQVNKKGQQFYSYNQPQYSYSNGASTLNVNIPFVVSSKMYGIYIENRTAGYFDIGSTNSSVFKYTVESGKISYYVITGNSFDEIMNSYTDLTGKQPLPPRWALGYMQSRFGYKTETETRNTVNDMISQDFPLDAIVLDLYWFGQIGDMGNLAWDYTNWPTPTTMISDFKKKGVKTILISEPYVTQQSFNYSYCDQNLLFGTDNTGGYTYIVPDFFAGSAGLLDIFKPQTRDWLWSKYKARTDEGVAGWWCDVGEPENHPSGMKHVAGNAREVHNVFALQWASLLFNKYKEIYPEQRLFNLTRSGFAGMQRYSTFVWSGDVNRSFDAFQAQIPIMLGMSMCGVGYMHSDLGGFTGGTYNPELHTRWLQFGAFCPIMRPHGETVGPEPIYYPETEKNIIRDFVKLRYQLMPYNYTLAWKNTETGRPLAIGINYFEPSNLTLSNVNDEYLWGENMLIAPVMTSGATSRNVMFPSGKWINYYTNEVYEGNTSLSVSAPLNQIPIFIKAGSFIPMVPKYNNTDSYNTDTLLVKYYPEISNSSTSFTIYDDNGETPDANIKGEYELLTFSGEVLEHQTNIHLSKSGSGFVDCPQKRSVTFEIQRQNTTPYIVLINGTESTIFTVEADFTVAENGAFYNSSEKVLYVKYLWSGSKDIIVVGNDNLYNGIDENKYFSQYLQYAFPNPFIENTVLNYNILKEGEYALNFYTETGALIQTEKFSLKPGSYSYNWKPKNLSSGIYLISLDGIDGKQWTKVVKK